MDTITIKHIGKDCAVDKKPFITSSQLKDWGQDLRKSILNVLDFIDSHCISMDIILVCGDDLK